MDDIIPVVQQELIEICLVTKEGNYAEALAYAHEMSVILELISNYCFNYFCFIIRMGELIMSLYFNELYMEDVDRVAMTNLPWDKLKNRTVLLSGATGLLGSFFIDVILEKNIGCTVYALSRTSDKAIKRFSRWRNSKNLIILP